MTALVCLLVPFCESVDPANFFAVLETLGLVNVLSALDAIFLDVPFCFTHSKYLMVVNETMNI
tara:strand:+ start:168 stop:356 length:189 start_codon:yes stop_codon:yes gene_type:complete